MLAPTLARRLLSFFVGVLIVVQAACEDPFRAFLLNVPLNPTEVTLFDFVDGRLQDPPAFDLVFENPVRVDQTRNWDFLFQIRDGVPELAPFTAATDSVSDSGLITTTDSFEGVLEAPEEGYLLSVPTPIQVGDVLIARSRIDPTQFLACSRYAKLEILEIDLAAGSLTFRVLGNPNCGDTVLEPGTHGSL